MGKHKNSDDSKAKKRVMKKYLGFSGLSERSKFWRSRVNSVAKQIRAGDNSLSPHSAHSMAVKLLSKVRRPNSREEVVNVLVASINRSNVEVGPLEARRLAYTLLGVKVPEDLRLNVDLLAEDMQRVNLEDDDEADQDKGYHGGGPKAGGGA